MTQVSGFFDSVAGDRIYNSAAFGRTYQLIQSDGYVPGYANQLQVIPTSPATMGIRVDLGGAFVQGRHFTVENTAEVLSLAAASPTNPRIDRVVIRLDTTNRVVSLAIRQGTAAVSPTAPSLTRTATIYEMSLAQVRVNAGATQITAANITDERNNALLCGQSAPRVLSSLNLTELDTARVTRGTSQSIPTGVATPISFDTVRWDTGGFFNAASPTRFTANTTHVYEMTGNFEFTPSTGGNHREIMIRLNGTTIIAKNADRNPSAYEEVLIVSCLWQMNEGDYVELLAYHDRGSALDVAKTNAFSPEFTFGRRGPAS